MAASGPGEGAGSQTLAVGQPLSSGPRGAGRRWGLGARLGLRRFPGPRPGQAGGGARPLLPGGPSPPLSPQLCEVRAEPGSPWAAEEGKEGTGREGVLSSCRGKLGALGEPGAQAEERRFQTVWESQEKVVKSESLRSTAEKKKKERKSSQLSERSRKL